MAAILSTGLWQGAVKGRIPDGGVYTDDAGRASERVVILPGHSIYSGADNVPIPVSGTDGCPELRHWATKLFVDPMDGRHDCIILSSDRPMVDVEIRGKSSTIRERWRVQWQDTWRGRAAIMFRPSGEQVTLVDIPGTNT
jgi:hypothetical protein